MRFAFRIAALTLALAVAACASPGGLPNLPGSIASAIRGAGTREHVIYNFQGGSDGASPQGTMIADKRGAFYGTTAYGGIYGCTFNAGCGTVFELMPIQHGYSHRVLYEFQGGKDGNGPNGGVVSDANGVLYGTTEYGGAFGLGTIFKLTRSGKSYKEALLHSFAGAQDGDAPFGGLTIDGAGNLFGATLLGGGGGSQCNTGAGCGVVFELQHSEKKYTERILYRFSGGRDGATPGSPPIFAGDKLFGTAATGGGNPSCGGAPINTGCGTVYELDPQGGTYHLHAIYWFTGMAGGDAANPFAGLIAGAGGTFYGLGQYGGKRNAGAMFALKPSGTGYSERTLHSFGATGDGSYPLYPLAVGRKGAFYGTTEYGGTPSSDGTVFEVTPSGSERVLLAFPNGSKGAYPDGGLFVANDGTLYGTASYGGASSLAAGIAFTL
ncbi:MAG TPA: choice-of-anchor tandem repeat GloVer-containing protein [Candidatus Cybelea sp.]|jgi:uncharacterized repeat protein (TIGR03803 family)|nr:choice-of-anchor tandem repeat GloVer-containing protein [Candidatus Cybelea sp.]